MRTVGFRDADSRVSKVPVQLMQFADIARSSDGDAFSCNLGR